MQPIHTLTKAQSFHIVEDYPDCVSDRDKRLQEVILPAMVVISENGKKFLLFQESTANLLLSNRDAIPSSDQLPQECPT